MTILAVDPGLQGALCVYNRDGPVFYDTPTFKRTKNEYDLPELVRILFGIVKEFSGGKVYAVIEIVTPHPKEGVVSAKTMGYGAGIWHMAFTMFGIPYETVSPQTWKKAFGLIGAEKKASIAVAKRIIPSVILDRVRDHNRADALLMALWLWEKRKL